MTNLVQTLVPNFNPRVQKIGIMAPTIHLAEWAVQKLQLDRREWFFVHEGGCHWYGLRSVCFLLYGPCWERSDWDCFYEYWHTHMPESCTTFFLREDDLAK